MKPQFNEYFQCSSAGYIKHQNVPVSHLPIIREIPVASRCNEILSYKLHKIQVKQPQTSNSARQLTRQPTELTLQIPSTQTKKQNTLNYSLSASLMQEPSQILEKDEVHSIHLDQKANSTRMNTVQNSVDLTKSTYTTSRKHSPDMKRSLFSTNNSVLTHYTISKQKQNEKLDLIVSEIKKQKQKREQFEKKYEILFNLVNRVEEAQETVTLKGPSDCQQKFQQNPEGKQKRKKKQNQKNKYFARSNTESSEDSEQDTPMLKSLKKSQRKGSSPSPIVINIGSQLLQKSSKKRKQKTVVNSENEEQQISEAKQDFQDIKREVEILHENVEYLEKKLDEQQARHQKEMLMQELKEKERKIEEVVKENKKIKEINELLVQKRVEPVQNQQSSVLGFNMERNSMGATFLFSLLAMLLVLNLKSSLC